MCSKIICLFLYKPIAKAAELYIYGLCIRRYNPTGSNKDM